MRVKEAMCKKPQFVDPSTSVADVAKLMRENDFGFIPVGDNDRLVGVATDRDLTIRCLAEGKDCNKCAISEVITPKVLYCYEDDDLSKAVKSMEEQQVRRLVVLNPEKRMTGILSLGDIARKTHDQSLCGEMIDCICEETKH